MTRRHAETPPMTAFPLLSPIGEARYVDAGTQRKFSLRPLISTPVATLAGSRCASTSRETRPR
ncbi:hypothetical protein [Scytonema sp. HK-05]|uniref:hypothetical protein n=1 Tax=Scytonema sp. HK-05 TaxID=1137095 RepID=UPI0011611EE1|nr:hypothetical protein [Scytonema sp. HK-05]